MLLAEKIKVFNFVKGEGQARGGKYYKRIKIGTDKKGKTKWKYFYNEAQYKDHVKKEQKTKKKTDKHGGLWERLSKFFKKTPKQTFQKVKEETENYNKESGEQVDHQTFADHLALYFEKGAEFWAKKFAPKEPKEVEEKEPTPQTEGKEDPEESDNTEQAEPEVKEKPEKKKINMNLMKWIHGKFSGGIQEEKPSPEKKSNPDKSKVDNYSQENNFDTMPENTGAEITNKIEALYKTLPFMYKEGVDKEAAETSKKIEELKIKRNNINSDIEIGDKVVFDGSKIGWKNSKTGEIMGKYELTIDKKFTDQNGLTKLIGKDHLNSYTFEPWEAEKIEKQLDQPKRPKLELVQENNNAAPSSSPGLFGNDNQMEKQFTRKDFKPKITLPESLSTGDLITNIKDQLIKEGLDKEAEKFRVEAYAGENTFKDVLSIAKKYVQLDKEPVESVKDENDQGLNFGMNNGELEDNFDTMPDGEADLTNEQANEQLSSEYSKYENILPDKSKFLSSFIRPYSGNFRESSNKEKTQFAIDRINDYVEVSKEFGEINTELTGSEKQITWAESIKTEKMEDLKEKLIRIKADAKLFKRKPGMFEMSKSDMAEVEYIESLTEGVFEHFNNKKESRFWIDNRDERLLPADNIVHQKKRIIKDLEKYEKEISENKKLKSKLEKPIKTSFDDGVAGLYKNKILIENGTYKDKNAYVDDKLYLLKSPYQKELIDKIRELKEKVYNDYETRKEYGRVYWNDIGKYWVIPAKYENDLKEILSDYLEKPQEENETVSPNLKERTKEKYKDKTIPELEKIKSDTGDDKIGRGIKQAIDELIAEKKVKGFVNPEKTANRMSGDISLSGDIGNPTAKDRLKAQEALKKQGVSIDKIKEIGADQIKTREQYTDVKDFDRPVIEGIKNSILKNGFDPSEAITIDDSNTVVDGHHRFTAVKELIKEGKLPEDFKVSIVRESFASEKDRLFRQMGKNMNRREVHPLDEAKGMANLVKEGASVEEIASNFNMPKQKVQNRLYMDNLAPDLKNLMRGEKRANDKEEDTGTNVKRETLPEGIAIALGQYGVKDDGSPNETLQRAGLKWFRENRSRGVTPSQMASYMRELKAKNEGSDSFFSQDDTLTDEQKEARRIVGNEEKAKRTSNLVKSVQTGIAKQLSKLAGDTVSDLNKSALKEIAASLTAATGDSQTMIDTLKSTLRDFELLVQGIENASKEIKADSETPSMFAFKSKIKRFLKGGSGEEYGPESKETLEQLKAILEEFRSKLEEIESLSGDERDLVKGKIKRFLGV